MLMSPFLYLKGETKQTKHYFKVSVGVKKMEKIHRYKTLKGLIRNTRQFSIYTLLSERYYNNKSGWGKLVLSPELRQEVYNLFSEFLGFDFNLNAPTCGLFERLIITESLNVQYFAGQEYTSELRYLKRLLK